MIVKKKGGGGKLQREKNALFFKILAAKCTMFSQVDFKNVPSKESLHD